MKRIWKTLTALVLTFGISLICLPATAYARRLSEEQKADFAGQHLAYAMKLILSEYVAGDVTAEELYEAALRGMTDLLDPYSVYLTEEEYAEFIGALSSHMKGVGISLATDSIGNIYIHEIVDASPAQGSGLAVGDRIKRVNGKSTTGLTAEEVVELVKNGGDKVSIGVVRVVEELEFILIKGSVKLETVFVSGLENLLPSAIGNDNSGIRYMYIESISEGTDKDLREQIEKLQSEGVESLILDLRGNGGGRLDVILSICNMLMPKGPIMHTQGKDGRETYYSYLEKSPFENIVVLTDGLTASAAEVLTAALQDSKAAVIVGQTTFGKGVIQEVASLPPGGVLKLTTKEYFRPNGGKINKVGVTPDVIVELPNYILEDIKLDEKNSAAGVTNLKKVLRHLGYETGELNNSYDAETRKAVAVFQTDHGLPESGYLTENTIYGLNSALAMSIAENDLTLQKAYELLR